MTGRRLAISLAAAVAVVIGSAAAAALLGLSPKSGPVVAVLVAVGVAVTAFVLKLTETAAGERIKQRMAGQAGQQTLRRAGLATDRHGDLPRVDELDGITLGVHRATSAAGAAPADLPDYVRRDLDTALDDALRAGGMVLLEGRSTAGKSRAAFEAIRRVHSGRRVLNPRTATVLTEVLATGEPLRNVLVWLDDLERYLQPGGLDGPLVDKLCAGGAVIVATLRTEERATLDLADRHHPDAPAPAVIRAAREVLDRATSIPVHHTFTPAELRRAGQHRADPRIADAIDHAADGGIPEYLAAGPAALAMITAGRGTTNPADPALIGAALVAAAIDCRRAGHHTPVPLAVLDEAHHHYLDRRYRHRTDHPALADALAWATRPIRGATSLLTPHPGDTYAPFDYLVDHAQRQDPASPVPDQTWTVLAGHQEITAANLLSVGIAAQRLGHAAAKAALRRSATDHHNPWAMGFLADLLLADGMAVEAESWYRRAATDHDNPWAMRNLGNLLCDRGEPTEAESWFRRAATDHDNPWAMNSFADFLAQTNRPAEAESWYRRAVTEHDHFYSINKLAALLRDRGEVTEAESWYRRMVTDHDDPWAMRHLGNLLRDRGEPAEAESWYRRAATEHDHPWSMRSLGDSLKARGELTEAESWYRRAAVDHDDAWGMTLLAELLKKRGEVAEAESWLRRGTEHDNIWAMRDLGTLLEGRGEVIEAESWYRRAAERGNAWAAYGLGALLARQDRDDEAEVWYRKAATEREHPWSMSALGDLCRAAGRLDEAESWYRRAAAIHEGPWFAARLQSLLAERGRPGPGD